MIYCPHCQKPSAGKSAECPHCGGKLPKPKEKPKIQADERPKKEDSKTRKQASKPGGQNKEAQYAETQKQDKSKQEDPDKEKLSVLKSAEALLGKKNKPEASKPEKKRLRLGETLIAAGIIDNEQLKTALEKQKHLGLKLGTILVQENFITEIQLVQALSHQADIRWIDISNIRISDEHLKLVPLNLAQNYLFVPIDTRESKTGDKVLFLAMDNPLDSTAIQAAQAAAGMKIEPLFASPSAIREAIRIASGEGEVKPKPAEVKEDVWRLPQDSSSLLEPVSKAELFSDKKRLSSDNVTQRQIIILAPKAQASETVKPQKKELKKIIIENESFESEGQRIQAEKSPFKQNEKRLKPAEEKPSKEKKPRTLTFLDGTTIQRTVSIQKGFTDTSDVCEQLLLDIEELDDTPESVSLIKEYLVAVLEIMFRKKLIFPEELSEQLKKVKQEP